MVKYKMKGRKGAYGRKRYVRRKRYVKKGRVGSKPTIVKRIGMPIRIANSSVSNLPAVDADGIGSLQIGTPAVDILNTYMYGGSLQFKLESVVQAVDLVQLFDRYKIVGVKLKFLYQQNIGSVGSTTGSILPIMNYSFDADDVVPPTLATDVTKKQYCHTKVLNANRTFSLFIKPRQAIQSNLSGAEVNFKAQWNNCANADIPHYGLKFFVNNWQATTSTQLLNCLTITPTYYLAMKDTQ